MQVTEYPSSAGKLEFSRDIYVYTRDVVCSLKISTSLAFAMRLPRFLLIKLPLLRVTDHAFSTSNVGIVTLTDLIRFGFQDYMDRFGKSAFAHNTIGSNLTLCKTDKAGDDRSTPLPLLY